MKKVVGVYGLEGKWVTLWASSAQSEFLATSEVQKVSTSVALFGTARMFCVVYRLFYLDYFAGGDQLREEVVCLPRG